MVLLQSKYHIVHKMDSNTHNSHSFDLDANIRSVHYLVTNELLSRIGIGNVQNTMHYTCSGLCLLVIVGGGEESTKTIV